MLNPYHGMTLYFPSGMENLNTHSFCFATSNIGAARGATRVSARRRSSTQEVLNSIEVPFVLYDDLRRTLVIDHGNPHQIEVSRSSSGEPPETKVPGICCLVPLP